jgi:hypothetical protein
MNTILSVFDYSGHWPAPFQRAGYDVIHLDLQHGFDVLNVTSGEEALEYFGDVDGILAAPPCTDFTVSGSQYWSYKDISGRTAQSMALVNVVLQLVDLYQPTDPDYDGTWFWALENPVGRLARLFPELGQPFYFHPWEYAGYLDLTDADHNELDRLRRKDGQGITPEESDFILSCNAYTKKTGLWGYFNRHLKKKPIEPVKACTQGSPLMRLGGKSEKTKRARSHTPEGFARAFFAANHAWRGEQETVQLELF